MFRKAAEAYYGDEINYIANNPREFSEFVSAKAKRTAEMTEEYAATRDSDDARYSSYQLGNKSVGLLRMEGGDSMNLVRGRKVGGTISWAPRDYLNCRSSSRSSAC
ncbi:hypothetical protein SAMN05216573_1398 [Bradyrhizobium sp. Rc3b]|nr:hypothetical protein SAMN05216573_1398 [Bradyrhizobium sp. Rc3b]